MKTFHSLALTLSLCAVVLAVGCRRKKTDDHPVPAPATAPAAPSAAATPQAGQSAPVIVSTRESKDTAYTLEMTQTLNDFLGDYIRQHKRIPKDINEMVSLKIITSIPVLPGGRKWVIDPQSGKISAQ